MCSTRYWYSNAHQVFLSYSIYVFRFLVAKLEQNMWTNEVPSKLKDGGMEKKVNGKY